MKHILFIACILLLISCSQSNSTQPVENESDVASEVGVVMSEQQVYDTVSSTLMQLQQALYEAYPYENKNFTTEEIQQNVQKLAPYATANYIEELTLSNFGCDEYDCTTLPIIATAPEYGWHFTYEFTDDETLQISTIFSPSYNLLSTEAVEEVVTFKLQEDTWKVDTFTFQDSEMNLTEEEYIPYLEQAGLQLESFKNTTVEIFDVQEEAIEFIELNSEVTFTLIPRTGYISPLDANYSEEMPIGEQPSNNEEYSFLFDDRALSLQNETFTDEQVNELLTRAFAIDQQWQSSYLSEQRDEIVPIRAQFQQLLGDVYSFFVAGYPTTDGVNSFEQDYNSWQANRENYFDSLDAMFPISDDDDLQMIILDTWIIRAQIFTLIDEETTKEAI